MIAIIIILIVCLCILSVFIFHKFHKGPIMTELIINKTWFKSDPPKIKTIESSNNVIKFIELETDNGAEYVRKIGTDILNNLYEKFTHSLALKANLHKQKMLDFFVNRKRDDYQTKFYKEAGEELGENGYEKIILLDSMMEVYVYLYIEFKKILPEKVIDFVGQIGCTFAFVKDDYCKDTKDVIIMRNYDWMTKIFVNSPVYIITFKQFGVKSIGFPGMIFTVISCINKDNVWCSINNATYSLGFSLVQEGYNITNRIFTLLKESSTALELGEKIKNEPFDISCFYFAGDKDGVIGVSHKGDLSTGKYEFTQKDNMDVVANRVTNSMWDDQKDSKAYANDSEHRRKHIIDLLNKYKGKLDDELVCQIYQEPLFNDKGEYSQGATIYERKQKIQDLTMYQIVFNIYTNEIYIRGNYPKNYKAKSTRNGSPLLKNFLCLSSGRLPAKQTHRAK